MNIEHSTMTESTETQLAPNMIGLFGEITSKLDALDTDERKRVLQAIATVYAVELPLAAMHAQIIANVRRSVREGWEEAKRVSEANVGQFGLGIRSGSNTVAMYVYRALHGDTAGS